MACFDGYIQTIMEKNISQNYPDRGSPPSMPRWVKTFGIVIIALVVVVVVMHLTGINIGGLHHTP
jgi:hypothetical protein